MKTTKTMKTLGVNGKIIINAKAWQRLRLYTIYAPGEISGLGVVEFNRGNFYIPEIYLFHQVSSSGDTRLDRLAVAKFYGELMEKGVPTEKIRLWWHSHANFETFWSPVDNANIDDFDNEEDKHNWLLSLEVNKDGNCINRLDFFTPLRFTVYGLPFEVETPDFDLTQEVLTEIKEKVKSPIIPKKKKKGRIFLRKNKKELTLDGEIVDA